MAKKDGPKKKAGEEGKKEIDFEKVSHKLARFGEEQKIDQIASALTDTYLTHAKYDKDGVTHYKEEFTREEAEALGDKLYDALGFHLHRRYLKIDEKGYESLKNIKDPDGKPYIDIFTEYHFEIGRKQLKKSLAKKKTGNMISIASLQELLQEPVQKHATKAIEGIISKEHLREPENREMVKGAIEGIIKEYQENPEDYELDRMDHGRLVGTYIGLAQKHYRKGAHPEKKKAKSS